MKALDLRVTGQVQGVAFRAWARDEALKLGVGGWVRNEPDGSVTARAEGSADAVDAFERALHEGPGAADVRDVTATPAKPEGLDGFEIRH